jgi:hypothetical protein
MQVLARKSPLLVPLNEAAIPCNQIASPLSGHEPATNLATNFVRFEGY